ncbi:MAG: hypothetical protein A2787_05400 [Omnitrophica WOR_2 bacterium RIFCSPHIGHO2_01_FULL_48_9]|nr:MAG: hypothetical protein A3D10_08080 [Omnitrophica WOR_2 bacterium RIFCSPHIGHO2_02_FULL_48_11]OGX32300.1 MAG: hypothetical protein A2787_05400 [Omnitrophica WOR_2 bacterium RIFCSPHIGHO2_01_FULL_48_9]
MCNIAEIYNSSIGKKQIVAVTGLMLVLFVIGHLAGNLFIYGGPDVYNAYAKKLAGLRPGLYVVEFGLLAVFLTHIHVTSLLVLENIRARGERYAVYHPVGNRSFATRLMAISGTIVLAFVIWHLLDFTFIEHTGPRSILGDGKSYGLYGVVFNAFADPLHSVLYVIAMLAVGMHLSHGVQSFMQTFGFDHPYYTPLIQKFSNIFACLVTIAYSSMPVYVLLKA